MSSRAQLDTAQQFKAWPPSPAEIQLLQQKMAPTATSSSNRHRTTEHSSSKRHHSRSATSGDPLSSSRPSKSTLTSKSHAFHASSSSEYVAKPSASRSQPLSDQQDPRARIPSSKHRDGTPRISKSKPIPDPYAAYAMLGTPAQSASTPAWTAYSEAPSEAPRKHRTKDKDRDKPKVKDKEKPSKHEREAVKQVVKDPYEQRPAAYTASSLGRNFKQRTEEGTKQPKASSHRRYPTDEDMLTAQPRRQASTEQQGPTILPTQAPQPAPTTSANPQAVADITRTGSRENRSYSPPPAPLVAPVWLPERDKARKSQKPGDRMNQQSGPSGSDTEREQRGTYRSHQRESSRDDLAKSHKKESKISLSGWFSRKPPKVPIESPAMPTPASVFFSPLPERSIPVPHLVSLKAGEGPADSNHPYMYHESTNKTPGVSNPSLYPAQETSSRKHNRSQSASQAPPKTTGAAQEPLRSQTLNVLPQAPTPQMQSHYATLPGRSRHTPAVVSSTLPSAETSRSHQRHATIDNGYSQGHYNDQGHGSSADHTSAHASSRPQPSVTPPAQALPPPKRTKTPSSSAMPTLSQLMTPRPKTTVPSTPARLQPTLPHSSRAGTEQHQPSHLTSTYGLTSENYPGSSSENDRNTSTRQKGKSSSQEQRNTGDTGHQSKSFSVVYPPGYASVSATTLPGTQEGTKRSKKHSPPVEASKITANQKYEPPIDSDPALVHASWSAVPKFSNPDINGHGASSIIASAGNSAAASNPSQDSPGYATPSAQLLQIPGTSDPSAHQTGSRPPSKPSPAESYLTVPIHSAQASPSRTPRGERLLGTPSSTSTIIQPPTPRTKTSHSPPKEHLLAPPETKVHGGHTSSPSRAAHSQDLHGASKDSSIPVISAVDLNELKPAKSRSYSHDQGSREFLVPPTGPVRSNTDPQGLARRTSTASLQAVLRGVQVHPSGTRYAPQDQYDAQYTPTQPIETVRTQAPNSEGHQSSRTRKRTTSQSNNPEVYYPAQAAPSSNRHRRERPPPLEYETFSTPVDIEIPLPQVSSNHATYAQSSSTHPTSTSRYPSNDHNNVSVPYSSTPAPAPASAPITSSSSRRDTYQPGTTRSDRPKHSRTASEPGPGLQPARVPVAGHLSTPAPTADQLPPPTPAQEAELLRTPSSLTHNLKRQPSYTTVRPPSAQSSHESKKKGGGFLGLFRSISNTAKQREVPAPVAPPPESRTKLRRASSSKYRVEDLEALKSPGSSSTRVIALPPVAPQGYNAQPMSPYSHERKVPPGLMADHPPAKGFHPWKLLSKRNRTISSASVEALDGTGLGHLNSPDGSVVSSAATSAIYPPLRDPMLATQEWRNQEELDLMDRGTIRRRRPGVTFELIDDNVSEPRSRPHKSSKLR